MSLPVKVNSWWVYVAAASPGTGVRHKVIEHDSGLVVTWSETVTGTDGGFSWMGPKEEFLKHFKAS